MAQFLDFWRAYPRRVGKRAALRAWCKLKEPEKEAVLNAVPEHVKHWNSEGIEMQFIPHPATWLNQGRWEDELESGHKVTAWWTSDETTLQHGKDRGVEPRPGETMADYRRRLRAA
jgi:hypothetical protein